MRPSNKRSRSKQNRPRSLGNIVNRVFDSSGPEGKVRGTPQQIIDKYLVLARDSQLSGDRVAAENFLQHAEHYLRMLNEAQAEMAREAEQRREQQGGGGGQPRRFDDRDGAEGQDRQPERSQDRQPDPRQDRQPEQRQERQPDQRQDRQPDQRRDDRPGDPRQGEGRMDWLGRRNRRSDGRNRNDGSDRVEGQGDSPLSSGDEDSMLVETPEARAERESRNQPVSRAVSAPTGEAAPRAEKPAEPLPDDSARTSEQDRPAPADPAQQEAASPPARAPRAPRAPRRTPAAAPEAASAPQVEPQDESGATKRAPRRRRAAPSEATDKAPDTTRAAE